MGDFVFPENRIMFGIKVYEPRFRAKATVYGKDNISCLHS